jgi:hypothetical protein
MDFDTRARTAAQGINRAVEVMEMSTKTEQPKVERFDRYRDRKNRNRRIGAVAVAAVIVILAVVVALNTVTAPNKGAPASTHWLDTPPATGGFFVDLTTNQYMPLPASIRDAGSAYAVSPDHRLVAYAASDGSGLFIANIDGTGVRQITSGDDLGPQWSPDGSKIVYQQLAGNPNALGNLFVYDVATGGSTQITHIDQSTRTSGWWVMDPSFRYGGPNGALQVLFQMPRGTKPQFWDLWSVPVSGGKMDFAGARPLGENAGWGAWDGIGGLAYATPVSPATFNGGRLVVAGKTFRGPVIKVRWSPDSTRLSYTRGVGGDVYVLNVRSGSVTKVVTGDRSVGWFDDNTLIVGN